MKRIRISNIVATAGIFIAVGVALAIYSDHASWPLSPKSERDREPIISEASDAAKVRERSPPPNETTSTTARANPSMPQATAPLADDVSPDDAQSMTDVSPRLEWQPQAVTVPDTVDLCDDDQAIAAGLDGGDLDSDRLAMGIDCLSGANRYAHTDQDGSLTFGDKAEGDDQSAEWEASASAPTSLLLGYRGPAYHDFRPPAGNAGALVVDPASLRTVDGVTYGIVVNTSNQVADNVVVEYAGARSEHPLSVQPGEAAPFALNAGDQGTVSGESLVDGITIDASLSNRLDLNRAVLVNAVPGLWAGPRDRIPAPSGIVDVSAAPEQVLYYETTFEVRTPHSHAEIAPAIESRSIDGVKVVVAFLNEHGAVLDLIHPQAMVVGENHVAEPVTSIRSGETVTVGFLVPHAAKDLAIWVGGTEPL